MRREGKALLDIAREVEFTEEQVVLLERQVVAAEEMARLARAALTGGSGTDWDAALAALEEKREWGNK